jgi:midasin
VCRAIEHGQWVLLDNVNLCNPSVLDRLNSLLETNGVLYLNECGMGLEGPRIISPHPNFRVFLALDPRHGEVSRAMRNRGIEVFLLPDTQLDNPLQSFNVGAKELETILSMEGLPGRCLTRGMANVQRALISDAAAHHR